MHTLIQINKCLVHKLFRDIHLEFKYLDNFSDECAETVFLFKKRKKNQTRKEKLLKILKREL